MKLQIRCFNIQTDSCSASLTAGKINDTLCVYFLQYSEFIEASSLHLSIEKEHSTVLKALLSIERDQ